MSDSAKSWPFIKDPLVLICACAMQPVPGYLSWLGFAPRRRTSPRLYWSGPEPSSIDAWPGPPLFSTSSFRRRSKTEARPRGSSAATAATPVACLGCCQSNQVVAPSVPRISESGHLLEALNSLRSCCAQSV